MNAEWVLDNERTKRNSCYTFCCSHCHHDLRKPEEGDYNLFPYCPYCGSKMSIRPHPMLENGWKPVTDCFPPYDMRVSVIVKRNAPLEFNAIGDKLYTEYCGGFSERNRCRLIYSEKEHRPIRIYTLCGSWRYVDEDEGDTVVAWDWTYKHKWRIDKA